MINSHKEKLLSGLGGGIAIFVVFSITRRAELSLHSEILLVASFGASAVLLFAVPHGPMSQPWNVIGGHVVSALIGVALHWLVADKVVASALAAGLAITSMHYLRCLHPPGGASAIIPILLGPTADQYGFSFALFPIGTGALALVVVAVIYNFPFAWRRYPLPLAAHFTRHESLKPAQGFPDIGHADFVAALAEIDTFVDISEDDLLRIYQALTRRDAASPHNRPVKRD